MSLNKSHFVTHILLFPTVLTYPLGHVLLHFDPITKAGHVLTQKLSSLEKVLTGQLARQVLPFLKGEAPEQVSEQPLVAENDPFAISNTNSEQAFKHFLPLT
jgi:hypothetical protein